MKDLKCNLANMVNLSGDSFQFSFDFRKTLMIKASVCYKVMIMCETAAECKHYLY